MTSYKYLGIVSIFLIFILILPLTHGNSLGIEQNPPAFYSYASTFQRTASIDNNKKINGLKIQKIENLSINVDEYENFGTGQWMIQNKTALFFHTDHAALKIDKDTFEITRMSFDDESKIWVDNLTYSHELNVLIGGFFQGNSWYIAVLNPDTMEVIQIVPGYGFTDSSSTMGTIVTDQKVFYLNTIDENCNIMSLTVGDEPEIVYSIASQSITSGSLSGEFLYLLGHTVSGQEAMNSMYCIHTKSKKLSWKHDFPTVHQRGIMYHRPICTSNGILTIRTDVGSRCLTIQCLNSDNGNILWNQQLPYAIDPNTLLNPLVSADKKEISMYIEAYQRWDSAYIPKIIVLSSKDGSLVREYSLTKNLQTITGIGDNIIVTTKKLSKKPGWIAVINRSTGQIITTEYVLEGSILSYPIIEDEKIWLLIQNQADEIAIVELLIEVE